MWHHRMWHHVAPSNVAPRGTIECGTMWHHRMWHHVAPSNVAPCGTMKLFAVAWVRTPSSSCRRVGVPSFRRFDLNLRHFLGISWYAFQSSFLWTTSMPWTQVDGPLTMRGRAQRIYTVQNISSSLELSRSMSARCCMLSIIVSIKTQTG